MAMTVMLHVFIALLSVIATTAAYVNPSRKLLRSSYALISLTLLTGTYLVLSQPAHMLQSCVTGVAYISLASLGVFMARRKFAAAAKTVQN